MSMAINPQIQVILNAIDNLTPTIKAETQAVNELKESIDKATASGGKFGGGQKSNRNIMRGVALDMRMISIATSIFRRELGDTNPVVDVLSRGLLMVSTTTTAVMAVSHLMTAANWAQALSWVGVSTAIKGATASLVTFLKVPGAQFLLALAVIGTAIMALGTYFSPANQAALYFKDTLEELEETAEATKLAIDDLKYAMEELQISQMKLRLQEQQIRLAIQRRGYATSWETELLKNLDVTQKELGISTGEYNIQLTEQQHKLHGTEREINAINKSMEDLATFGFAPGYAPIVESPGRGAPPGSPFEEGYEWGQQGFPPTYVAIRRSELPLNIGGRMGRPLVRRGTGLFTEDFVRPTPSLRAEDIRGIGGGGQPINVTISLAGAIISKDIDLRDALIDSGEEAALEIKRRMK